MATTVNSRGAGCVSSDYVNVPLVFAAAPITSDAVRHQLGLSEMGAGVGPWTTFRRRSPRALGREPSLRPGRRGAFRHVQDRHRGPRAYRSLPSRRVARLCERYFCLFRAAEFLVMLANEEGQLHTGADPEFLEDVT